MSKTSKNTNENTNENTIIIYTDGSFIKHKNKTLCGYGIYFPNKELKNVSAPYTHENKTNNRAELHAIYQALLRVIKGLKFFDKIKIYTDSEYSKKSLTEWIISWKKNNWVNSKNKPVENQDIIKKIDYIMQKYPNKIKIHWVRAHTNNNDENSINNAKADELAKKGALIIKKYIL
jgi:ribonuclease HI